MLSFMKFLGIDYGSRNVGIALSDEDGKVAFPRETLLNTSALVEDILRIIHNEEIGGVVLGDSKDLYGEDNPIMKRIAAFKEELEEHGIPVYFEDERFSSQEASRGQESLPKSDAGAATIILQSYLDKRNKE